jgi:hypothetical protein
MTTNLETEITDAARAPKSSDVEGIVTTERDLRELIAADEYLRNKAASTRRKRGLSFARLVPPGTAE